MLFLITCVIDEGVDKGSFIVVEAESELEIAQHMLTHTDRWEWFLDRAYPEDWRREKTYPGTLIDCIRENPTMKPVELLELINITSVDGDSTWQLRIYPITVQSLQQVETNPWKRPEVYKRITDS
ncbi:hypothetical protein [Iningainema tapete]|uniref:Uncharacterized protein n=1 Tax=Iningainema tapete BLCC-T55 TaxID=2748662 RepID=A0A8J6XH89_9CYAN|nr:hypothetical protein [Iningainema tapete]MBD2773320.1 hypothetical protein [Iningainema tapete BLCC-T55]